MNKLSIILSIILGTFVLNSTLKNWNVKILFEKHNYNKRVQL